MRANRILRRRDLLLGTAALLGASGVSRTVRASACVPADGADASLRESLHYVDTATNPAERCKTCGFFSDPEGLCGKCAIFSSATDATGHCDSWAARS
jgi:hypothetical protein